MSEEQIERRRLKVGILIDSIWVPAWVDRLLGGLESSDVADLCVAVHVRAEAAPARPKGDAAARMFRAYERADQTFSRLPLDAFALIDAMPRLAHGKLLTVVAISRGDELVLGAEDTAALSQCHLDVLLDLGAHKWSGEILGLARFGVWSHYFGDPLSYRGGPAYFWEIYDKCPISGSALVVRRSGDPATRILYRSLAATNPSSLYRNRNPILWKTSAFALRRLRDLHARGWDWLEGQAEFGLAVPDRETHGPPGLVALLRFTVSLGWRYLSRQFRNRLYHPRWYVGVRQRQSLDPVHFDPQGFAPLAMPSDRFYADPFLVERAGVSFLFFEDADVRTGKGVIACCRLNPDGTQGPTERVLERPYHLSYPFVFEHESQIWMIPETSKAGRIELYRSVKFPARWELDRILLEGVSAVDTTMFPYGGRYWFFTAIGVPGGTTFDELHLFYSDSPLGPFTPHPLNPVVSDARRARPAGRIFRNEGAWIRPSQYSYGEAGWAITLNRIDVLSDKDYVEVPMGRIEPWFRGCVGVHTIERGESFEVIDWRAWSRK